MNWNTPDYTIIAKSYDPKNHAEYDFSNPDDPDVYDDLGEVNDPSSPIWDGSDSQNDIWGDDSSLDSND